MSTLKGYFSSLDSNDIKGGLYQVDNYLDLFKINAATHFKDGMICYISSRDKYYQYYAKKKRWAALDISRSDVIDTSILIDGLYYSVTARDTYDAMLQELVRLKYTNEQQFNLAENMRAYPELYQSQEDQFQEWYTLCKQAAWYFIYGKHYDITNKEGDINNKFDYPILKDKLNKINEDINYLYLAVNALNIDLSTNNGYISDDDNIYIEYTKLDSISINLKSISMRSNNYTDLVNAKLIDWNNNIIYNSSTGFDNLLLTINKPEQKIYPLLFIACDTEKGSPIIRKKNIIVTMPYFYGCSSLKDLTGTTVLETITLNIKESINSIFCVNFKYISDNYNLVLLDRLLYVFGITNQLVINLTLDINKLYDTNITLNLRDFLNIVTLRQLYDMIADKIMQQIIEKKNKEYMNRGYTDEEENLYSLDGTNGGIKYLPPLKKIDINISEDGYYFWVCIPEAFHKGEPEITVNNFPFGLDTSIYLVEATYGNYICYRSYGNNGLESSNITLYINY